MKEQFVSISADILQRLLHLDANRCGMEHLPYRGLMAEIRRVVIEQIGTDGITPERKEK